MEEPAVLKGEGKTAAARYGSRRGGGRISGLWEVQVMGRLWHMFTSMKLALLVILSLALFTLEGTLIDQVPPGIQADRFAYDQWLIRAHDRYGGWTDVMDRLQLFNVFHSLIFRALIGLLVVNIVICTTNRWRSIWNTAFHTRVRMTEGFFGHSRYNVSFETAMPASEAAERVRKTLRSSHYHVKSEAGETSVALLGDRNRFSRFGTFLTHLALVLILAGAAAGGLWGFKDKEFIVSEGATRTVAGTDISIRLDHFADEYYPDGAPKDYKSEVVLFDNGRQVKQGTVRVNSPMRYQGIAFHQAFYGQTAVMSVRDKNGSVVFNEPVPLAYQTRDGNRPVGSFNLPQQGLVAYVVGPRSGADDPLVRAGEMRIELYRQESRVGAPQNLTQGTPADLAGLSFTFERESRFTGMQVVKDPGVNVIWAASILMLLGMVALFYFRPSRLWALCASRPNGTTSVHLAIPAQRDFSLESEFGRLREKLAKALEEPERIGGSKKGTGGG